MRKRTEDHPPYLTPPQARRLGYLSTPELMDLIVDDPGSCATWDESATQS